jgi:hypothetical protein
VKIKTPGSMPLKPGAGATETGGSVRREKVKKRAEILKQSFVK